MSVFVDDTYFRRLNPYGYDIQNTITDDPDRHYFYDEVNHLVLLVGWTTEEIDYNDTRQNQTFWIIQNSWGEDWGVIEADGSPHGAMKIAMGMNAYAIESQPVTTYWVGSQPSGAGTHEADYKPATIALGVLSGALAVAVVAQLAVMIRGRARRATGDHEETQELIPYSQ